MDSSRPRDVLAEWVCEMIFVLDAIHELGAATTKEIVDHPKVGRGERQVQRALSELESEDIVDWRRNGSQIYNCPLGREDLIKLRLEE